MHTYIYIAIATGFCLTGKSDCKTLNGKSKEVATNKEEAEVDCQK